MIFFFFCLLVNEVNFELIEIIKLCPCLSVMALCSFAVGLSEFHLLLFFSVGKMDCFDAQRRCRVRTHFDLMLMIEVYEMLQSYSF